MTTDLCEMPHKTSQASVFDLQKIKPSILQQVGRVHALDGLRGLFALLVFGYHLWDSDRYALRYFNGDGIERFLSLTPFTALTAGWQYVLGFFILSGFALMSPLIKPGRRIRWVAYYCSRIVRLYLPVLVSILLAACLAYYFTHASPGLSYTWLKAVAPYPIGFGNISDALLLGTPDGGYPTLNSPLWSLRWEIIFSLLLPLLAVILVNGLRKLSPIAMLGLLLALAFLMLFLQNALVFYLTISCWGC